MTATLFTLHTLYITELRHRSLAVWECNINTRIAYATTRKKPGKEKKNVSSY
jgi:hypothetical protein